MCVCVYIYIYTHILYLLGLRPTCRRSHTSQYHTHTADNLHDSCSFFPVYVDHVVVVAVWMQSIPRPPERSLKGGQRAHQGCPRVSKGAQRAFKERPKDPHRAPQVAQGCSRAPKDAKGSKTHDLEATMECPKIYLEGKCAMFYSFFTKCLLTIEPPP